MCICFFSGPVVRERKQNTNRRVDSSVMVASRSLTVLVLLILPARLMVHALLIS